MTTPAQSTMPWWREPTRGQWASFAAAWVGWVLDAFDFTIYILVMSDIAKEFGVGTAAVAGSLTLTLLVRLAGGGVAGWMADRWGRRLPLMLSLVWFAVFDAAIFFAPSFTWVLVFRTLFGFGMGAEWTAGTALAMESFPARSRKIASGLLQAGWPVGFFLAAITAYFVVPAWGWRSMFLIAVAPALLVLPIRFMVPDDRAHASAATTASKGALRDLWVPAVRTRIVLGAIVMALGFVVYYGLTTTHSLIQLRELGLSQQTAFANVCWFQVGMLVGVIVAGIVADRFGVIAALVTPALLMVPALPLFVGAYPGLVTVGAVLGGLLGAGYSGVTPVLVTSLFPEHVRARAIGLVYHLGALLAAFVPWGIPALAARMDWKLSTAVEVVVGAGLVAMAAAVFGLRRMLAPTTSPIDVEDAPAVAAAIVDAPAVEVPALAVAVPPPAVDAARPAAHLS
ncbi:MAG: MFS transporter [Myxococcales bacterium]|nr:MFS transporter [Myxococcales bacterium]